jgi:hypothetical protein
MDKTKQEREHDYQLRQERRRRMNDGETNLVIRSGKIVKLAPLGPSTRGRQSSRGTGRGGRQGGGRQ